jgi:hypothetical protein
MVIIIIATVDAPVRTILSLRDCTIGVTTVEVVVVVDLSRINGPLSVSQGVVNFTVIVACINPNRKLSSNTKVRHMRNYLFP